MPRLGKVLVSFYIGHFSGGENTLEKAFELFRKLNIRFLEGLFYLRKWRTNDPKLRGLISENNESELKPKILGIIWNETNDPIGFLQLISSQRKEFKIFVEDRVQEICRNSNLSNCQY